MARTRIGLDIGSTAVRAAELTEGTPPAVIRAAQVPLQPGAVENGEVREADAVAEGLRELWARGGFKSRRVYMGVGNQRVVVREVALPSMPEKELRQSLGFQVQEFIPMPVDEAVLDFHVIEETEIEGRQMVRLLLVAAQKAMVDTLVAAATSAKLEPLGLDLVPFALVRSVGAVGAGMELEERGGEAIVDVGAHVTNIVVHSAGETRFVRILPSGGRDVTNAIARAPSVWRSRGEARREPGEPPSSRHPRRPTAATDGGRGGPGRRGRDRLDPHLLRAPAREARRRSRRHREPGAEQREPPERDRAAPAVRRVACARPGEAGAAGPGVRERGVLLGSLDGRLARDPLHRGADVALRVDGGARALDGRDHA